MQTSTTQQYRRTSTLVSWASLFACNLMWALQFTCIKLVQNQVGPLTTVWIPTTISAAMLWPIVRAEKRTAQVRKAAHSPIAFATLARLYLLLVVFGVVPGQLLMTIGTRYSLASNAAMITLALPVTTALSAVLFLSEKMNRIRWISFAFALCGVILASSGTLRRVEFNRGQLLGNLLVFLAILGSSFYNSYGKKALEYHSPLEMLFWTYLCLSVCLTPFVFGADSHLFSEISYYTAHTWTGLALLTFFHAFLAMVLFLKALKHLDAIQAALSNYLIALFGIPIAAVWLGEHLSSGAITGGALILGSTILVAIADR
jgi:Permeases of the drug/metabolite transporter (DMT) superfamily